MPGTVMSAQAKSSVEMDRLSITDKKYADDNGIVLTSFFTRKHDPQRNNVKIKAHEQLGYFRNFITSVKYNRLNTGICYDEIEDMTMEMVTAPLHGPNKVQMIQREVPVDASINDFRFQCYLDFLRAKQY